MVVLHNIFFVRKLCQLRTNDNVVMLWLSVVVFVIFAAQSSEVGKRFFVLIFRARRIHSRIRIEICTVIQFLHTLPHIMEVQIRKCKIDKTKYHTPVRLSSINYYIMLLIISLKPNIFQHLNLIRFQSAQLPLSMLLHFHLLAVCPSVQFRSLHVHPRNLQISMLVEK